MSVPPVRIVSVVAALVALLLAAGADAQDSKPSTGKLTPVLDELASSAGSGHISDGVSLPARGPGSLLRDGNRLIVDVRFTTDAFHGADELSAAGAEVIHTSSQYQTVTVAAGRRQLPALSRLDGVQAISENLTPMIADPVSEGIGGPPAQTSLNTCQGAKTSEGDTQLKAVDARTQFDIDGAGVKVGVLSDSFNLATGAPTDAGDDVSSGDLPGPGNPCGHPTAVQILHDDAGSGDDEGRAMAQIVHDLAPGASLAFSTAFTGELAFADNIRGLQAAGAKVIVDDVTYFDEPFFQDGPISVAVNDVTAAGASYFSSAGNSNVISGGKSVASYEAPSFRSSTCPAGVPAFATQCMDFNPGAPVDSTYGLSVPNGQTVSLDLQWAQPWYGVSTDLDAYLLTPGGTILAQSATRNVHGVTGSTEIPFEFVSWENTTGSTQTVNLALNRYTGSGGGNAATPRLKFISMDGGVPTEYVDSASGDVVGPTIFGHNGAANTMSVAAVPYNNSAAPESYSSRGPLALYFGPVNGTTAASAIATQTLAKPDIAATDGGANTFFGGISGGSHRFYGTSAAAPHAAAVAALQRQNNPSATVAQIRSAQVSTAASVGAFGAADVGGGLVNALAASSVMTHTLTTTRSGAGTGTITSSPAGINCGATCSKAFGDGRQVTLTATPTGGAQFTGWSGGGCSGTGTCQITISANVTVNAVFGPDTTPPETTISSGPANASTIFDTTPTFSFVSSETPSTFECNLDNAGFTACTSPYTAAPLADGHHTFAVRAIDGSSNADPTPASVGFDIDTTTPRTLTVSVAGSGAGTVTGPGINCPGDCIETYANGTAVTLASNSASGSIFTGFSGGCSGSSCNLTMSADRSVTATFDVAPPPPPPRTLTVSTSGAPAGGTVTGPGISCPGDCTESYAQGTTVSLTASPSSSSFYFPGFSGDCTGATCSLTMNSDHSVDAMFSAYLVAEPFPPVAAIDGPAKIRTRKKHVKTTFSFSANAESTFECAMVKAATPATELPELTPCSSPESLTFKSPRLKNGARTSERFRFYVQATDPGPLAGPVQFKSFTVVRKPKSRP